MISIERILLSTCVLLFGLNAAKADELLTAVSPGRPAAKALKLKSSKVPTYEMYKGNTIPRLDIGEEATLKYTEPAPIAKVPTPVSLKPVERLPSPAVVTFDLKKSGVQAAVPAKNFSHDKTAAPEVKALGEIAEPTTAQSTVEPKKLRELSSAESRLLEAQIMLEKRQNPQIALGLLVELLDDKNVATEARYSYALAARQLGLHSEFRATMMKMAQDSKNKDWARTATEALVREVEALEIADMKVLWDLVAKYDIDTEKNDAFNFYRAKYFLETGDLSQVEDALKFIPENSKYRPDARLIGALSAYRSNHIDHAQAELEAMLKETSTSVSIRSIGALTLARIHFQKSQYKEATEAYLQVDRNNPQWMQAMVENAWAQILREDYEGAAGNMFSLHTDFFKNSFAPESYTVRSVAYLNLCQYGDGLQVLNSLEHKYGPLVGRLEHYRGEKKKPQDYYDTVRNWLKNSDLKEVDGLPRSFIVELARHPSFMNVQSSINNFEDELERFNKVSLDLVAREKDLLKSQSDLRAETAKVKKAKGSTDDLEAQIAGYKVQYDLTKKARGLIKDARTRAQARIDQEKVVLKQKASGALKKRLETLIADLTHAIEQNEVLKYEIAAGAGEHLRTLSAGGNVKKTGDHMPASDEKKVKWDFKGEIWEDEVGHFRSSLKSVCTQDDKVAGN